LRFDCNILTARCAVFGTRNTEKLYAMLASVCGDRPALNLSIYCISDLVSAAASALIAFTL
jgi:hypothetical protein